MTEWRMTNISELVGQTFIQITNTNNEITFVTTNNATYKLYHEQDCCERVEIEDIVGDLIDLIGSQF